jgi:glutamine synthetase
MLDLLQAGVGDSCAGSATADCASAGTEVGWRLHSPALAPVNSTWGLENRSVAVRVKGLAGERLHVENRVPCGASNPYLVGAAAVAAGLDGIRNRIEPPAALDGLAYGFEGPARIPVRLEAALDELEKDARLRELLGEELAVTFLAVKRHEVAKATERAHDYAAGDWADRVDQFEVDELFEFL